MKSNLLTQILSYKPCFGYCYVGRSQIYTDQKIIFNQSNSTFLKLALWYIYLIDIYWYIYEIVYHIICHSTILCSKNIHSIQVSFRYYWVNVWLVPSRWIQTVHLLLILAFIYFYSGCHATLQLSITWYWDFEFQVLSAADLGNWFPKHLVNIGKMFIVTNILLHLNRCILSIRIVFVLA